jgi:hypothetical protein
MERHLNEWAAGERMVSAPVHVEVALRYQLRALRWRRRLRCAAPLAAVAALTVLFWPSADPRAERREIAAGTRPEAPVLRPAAEPAAEAKPLADPVRRPRRPRRSAPQPFIPVGAWQAVEPLERASIVRATVPRTALVSYGMPIGTGPAAEPEVVELLLGEDGTVRAIRLALPVQ